MGTPVSNAGGMRSRMPQNAGGMRSRMAQSTPTGSMDTPTPTPTATDSNTGGGKGTFNNALALKLIDHPEGGLLFLADSLLRHEGTGDLPDYLVDGMELDNIMDSLQLLGKSVEEATE